MNFYFDNTLVVEAGGKHFDRKTWQQEGKNTMSRKQGIRRSDFAAESLFSSTATYCVEN